MENLQLKHVQRISWGVMLTAITMIVEIIYGMYSGSMALLAFGSHLDSHVLAIGISWIAFVMVRQAKNNASFHGNSDKILSLSAYASGLGLLVFAIFILLGAFGRFIIPVAINYNDAFLVATLGLALHLVGTVILFHYNYEHRDQNNGATYLHVLADALSNLGVFVGFMVGIICDVAFVNAIAAVISSIVIIKWSSGLLKNAGRTLLDMNMNTKTRTST